MKVTVTQNFYDMAAFTGRRVGEVLEVPEDRGARLIGMRLVKAGKVPEPEKAEEPKAKPAAKTAAKKTVKKTDPTASA